MIELSLFGRVSQRSLDWSQILNLPASASQVLGLQVYTTTPDLIIFYLKYSCSSKDDLGGLHGSSSLDVKALAQHDSDTPCPHHTLDVCYLSFHAYFPFYLTLS
jgi:hypothetical protein